MKAVFLDANTLDIGITLDSLQELPVNWTFFKKTHPEETLSRVKDAHIVVTNKVLLTQEIIKESPHLKLICIAATGYNNVDLLTAKKCGITVCNVPAYSTPSVVQLTMAFMLALATNLIAYVEMTRAGKWQKSTQFCILDEPIIELEGKKLGIIGFGTLGKRVGMLAEAMGMHLLVAQHSVLSRNIQNAVPLERVLNESDIVSIHCPLTQETRNMIGYRELVLMKRSAFLINTARGGIVNEKELAEALKNGIIAGAGVDVLSVEPPHEDNPLLHKDIPNLLLTPHIAWGSRESRMRLVQTLKENIICFLNSTPKNLL